MTRRVFGGVLTTLAALLVLAELVAPDDIGHLGPGAFVRIPVEGLVAAGVLLVLPATARRVAAAVGGALLGLLAVLKAVDVGFSAALGRPFDLVLDWGLLGDATGVAEDSLGRVGAAGTVLGALLLVAAVVVLTTLSVLRLTGVAVRNRTAATRTVAALAVVWVALAAFGTPIASRSTAALVYDRAGQVRAGLHDDLAFRAEASEDPYRRTPAGQLLTGLRGKDVVISFVESYGRSAVEDPAFSTQVDAVLDAGTRRLKAAGFGSRSAFLTSSTVGGGSWLAHATLLSGLWINNEQRYRRLVAGDRLTLSSAFGKAGWRTVSVEPAIDRPWPEGRFYGYDKAYDSRNLGYRGPRFSYATMPDQYTFAQFQRAERGPGHAPVMAEITLVSSHSPWTPLPRMVPWQDVGDGTIFATPAARQGGPASSVLGSPSRLRRAYRDSIEYSLSALISYLEKYGGDDLVLVFLGDHQPAPVVTGAGAGRDVPVTVVAKDPAVLARIAGWGWQDGLNPGPRAPVWRMDAFRDRFLTAFGTPGSAH
ncbi:MAG: sulfatase [Mycobacteriales bacterium]